MAQEELVDAYSNENDFEKVANSAQFVRFLQGKKRFLIPMTAFFMIFYFLLPILTSYTTFLNSTAFGDISWTWIFAFSQFFMVWLLSGLYMKKATIFDKEAEEIIKKQLDTGGM